MKVEPASFSLLTHALPSEAIINSPIVFTQASKVRIHKVLHNTNDLAG